MAINMTELFSLGKLFISDFLKEGEQPKEPVELKLIMTDDGFVKLSENAPKESMWGKYWYRSAISLTMRKQLKDVVDSILNVFKVNGVWLDIAGNDGTLPSNVPENITRVSIDPAEESYHKEASKYATSIQSYFSAKVFKENGFKSADVVSCISMFYDLDDPDSFLKDVHEILSEDGLFVLQMSYSGLMIKQMEFTNICHEHRYYYSLKNIKTLLERNGFQIMDASLNDTNCGSIRIHAMRQTADITKYYSQPYRDVCSMRYESLLRNEEYLLLDDPIAWQCFYDNIEKLKKQVVQFIKWEKAKGKTIMGYSASTKGNTFLQFCGLDNTLIDAIAEKNPDKYGLRTVGTNIPIISEEEMRKRKPDYLLILPFHFINEFIERESEYLKAGGHFIVPVPTFKII